MTGVAFFLVIFVSLGFAQRPATDKHVREVAKYLDGVKILEPDRLSEPGCLSGSGRRRAHVARTLADARLGHNTWRLAGQRERRRKRARRADRKPKPRRIHLHHDGRSDCAAECKPAPWRHDVVLAPGQKIDLDVYCVEARRWAVRVEIFEQPSPWCPQSIQGSLRKGTDQSGVWSDVARNNAELKSENATGSLELALKAAPVQSQLTGGSSPNRSEYSPRHDRFHLCRSGPRTGRRTVR